MKNSENKIKQTAIAGVISIISALMFGFAYLLFPEKSLFDTIGGLLLTAFFGCAGVIGFYQFNKLRREGEQKCAQHLCFSTGLICAIIFAMGVSTFIGNTWGIDIAAQVPHGREALEIISWIPILVGFYMILSLILWAGQSALNDWQNRI